MNSKCRSCQIARDQYLPTGKHEIVNAGLYCPLCNCSGKSIFHGEHEKLSGVSLECFYCNNYIIYASLMGTIWKDEIYLDRDYSLIRDMESFQSFVCINDDLIYTLDHIVQFTNPKDLFNKLKTMVLFS